MNLAQIGLVFLEAISYKLSFLRCPFLLKNFKSQIYTEIKDVRMARGQKKETSRQVSPSQKLLVNT